jgi:small subunit ribosomal protein S17e
MGRVRTKQVKKASKVLIEKHYPRMTVDFETNKRVISESAITPSKRIRNKVFLLFNIYNIKNCF